MCHRTRPEGETKNGDMGSKLRLVTLNVNGLGSVVKRKRIEGLLRKKKADIIFLQETHQKEDGRNQLKLGDMGIYEKAYGTSKARGVAIIISKKCAFNVVKVVKDVEGRFIILQGLLGVEKYILINVYAPNVKQVEFYDKVFRIIGNLGNINMVMAGDFNMVMDRSKDKDNSKGIGKTGLARVMEHKEIKDVWREIKGDETKYTFYSPKYKSFSRIDYIFVTKNMLSKIMDCEIDVIKVSDHAVMTMDIKVKKDYREAKRWRLDTRILNYKNIVEKMKKEIKSIWEINEVGIISQGMVWDTMKAVVRGICIRETCKLRRQQEAHSKKIEEDIKELEQQFRSKKDMRIYAQLQAKKKELEGEDIERVQKELIYMKRNFFEYSNRNSRMLARSTQSKKEKNIIGTIKDKMGKKCNLMRDKLKIFEGFYRELYTSDAIPQMRIQEYVEKNWKVKLKDKDRDYMEALVTEKEIEESIDKLKGGKSPGVDGLGPEYYKIFKEILVSKMEKLFNNIIKGEKTPPSWEHSLIILIPKVDKDLMDPASYRPISLINQDAKIFTAIMAKRLNTFINDYIKKDQCGFIPGRQMPNLIGRVLNIINSIKRRNLKAGLIALDIFKAFDCVEWPALKTIVKIFGFGERFVGVINQLYANNKAEVLVNDGLTQQITLARGTRQGCPLSPILFAIVIEMLANCIREDEELKGIGEQDKIKINMFADDTLLTLENPGGNIEGLQKHLREFGEVTGLQINWGKSNMMLFNYDKVEEDELSLRLGLKVKNILSYLGVFISKELEKLEEINFSRLKIKILQKLEAYRKVKLSWFGRIAVIKMKILPMINFLFRMLPIQISEVEIKSWQSMINNYCNGDKKPRINKINWYKNQREGGLGLPNIKMYYIANQLRYVISSIVGDEDLEWLEPQTKKLEFKLQNVFFSNIKKIQLKEIINPILRNIRDIWGKYKKKLMPGISPLSPVVIMDNFPGNLRGELEGLLRGKKIIKLKDWVMKMTNKKQIEEILMGQENLWFKSMQLEQWTVKWKKQNKECRKETSFEKLIEVRQKVGGNKMDSRSKKGLMSEIYKILVDEDKGYESLKMIWEEDLKIQITGDSWRKIWESRNLKLFSIRIKENQYKIIWRWYLTPVRLHQIDKKASSYCWRGCQELGTYYHMWWTCEHVKKFWERVFKEINEIVDKKVEASPKIALLGLFDKEYGNNNIKELINNLLTPARLMIAKNWKTQGDYCMEEWYKGVWDIAINDRLTCAMKVKMGLTKKNDFGRIWAMFLEYVLEKGRGCTPSKESMQFWKNL